MTAQLKASQVAVDAAVAASMPAAPAPVAPSVLTASAPWRQPATSRDEVEGKPSVSQLRPAMSPFRRFPMATIEELEQRRAARRAKHDTARDEQERADLEAIDALEEASGEPLHTMTANGFKPGSPVKAAYRTPSVLEYKRYCDQVGKAQQLSDPNARRKAQELLAEVCWVYPAEKTDERKSMLDAFPGVLISLAIECAKVAELRSESEGK